MYEALLLFNSDKECQQFREWFNSGDMERAFKEWKECEMKRVFEEWQERERGRESRRQ